MPRKKQGKRFKELHEARDAKKKQGKPALHTYVSATDCIAAAAKATSKATKEAQTAASDALAVLAQGSFRIFVN